MWFGHEFSWGWAIFSVLMMVAFWGGFIALAVWVVRGFSRAGSAQASSANGADVSPGGSALEILKERYGDKLVFWGGGMDSQHILPFKDPEEVRLNVKSNMEAFKHGGGYVFNNVHNIQAGVPPANIIAMYEAAYEFGIY